MKKYSYILILVAFIILAFVLMQFSKTKNQLQENSTENYIYNEISNSTQEKNTKETTTEKNYNLSEISFNNLKIGDDASSSTSIANSDKSELEGVKIMYNSDKKIELLQKTNSDIEIKYNEKTLSSVEDFENALGRCDTETIYHNDAEGKKEYVYEQTIQGEDEYTIYNYSLDIIEENGEITNVTLRKTINYVMN